METMVIHDVVNTAHRPQKPQQAASRIRNNLIFKLGVDIEKYGFEVRNREPSRGSLLGNVSFSKEPLKYKKDETVESKPDFWGLTSLFTRKVSMAENGGSIGTSCSSRNSSNLSESSESRRLTFNEEVVVCPIPKRDEYSKRIRNQLWVSPENMMLNAHRNTVEFAAEGWDWRNTMEDENMYRCVSTNELIHPVHVEQRQPP